MSKARDNGRASHTEPPAGGSAACVTGGGPAEGRGRTRTLQDVVDAVTGATWDTRNRIMEDVFHERLAASEAPLPAFAPPGTPIKG